MTFSLPRSTRAAIQRRTRPSFALLGAIRPSFGARTDLDELLEQQRSSTQATVRGYETLQQINPSVPLPGGIPSVGGPQLGYQLAPPAVDFTIPKLNEIPSVEQALATKAPTTNQLGLTQGEQAAADRLSGLAEHYALLGQSEGDIVADSYDAALQQLNADLAMQYAQREAAIAQGLTDIAAGFDAEIQKTLDAIGRVQTAREGVTGAYSRYRQAVEPIFERAVATPLPSTDQLEAIGRAAEAEVLAAFDAGTDDLRDMLVEVAGDSPALADELAGELREWEGLVTDAIREGTASQADLLSASGAFAQALTARMAADDRLTKGVDEAKIKAEIDQRIVDLNDQLADLLAARDQALADAEAQMRAELGNLEGVSRDAAWEVNFSNFAANMGWNFEEAAQIRAAFDELYANGYTTRADAVEYIRSQLLEANMGTLRSLAGDEFVDALGAALGPQALQRLLIPQSADDFAALKAAAQRALGALSPQSAANVQAAIDQLVEQGQFLDEWEGVFATFDSWEHHVRRWSDYYQGTTQSFGTAGGSYWELTNRQRRAHPAYQARAQQITGIGQQLAAAFGMRVEQDRALDEFADHAGRGQLIRGRSTRSDHYWGGALDFFGSRSQMAALADYLRQNASRFGVQYVLFDNNEAHRDHVHVSFLPPPVTFGGTSIGPIPDGGVTTSTAAPPPPSTSGGGVSSGGPIAI